MKTRNGFVSNSSSSSFIVVFPKELKSSKDILDMMSNGKEGGFSVYDSDSLSYTQISEIVYKDMLGTLDTKAFIKEHKNKFIYVLEYSDHNIVGCTLEHGNIFKNIDYIRISNH